MNFGKMIAYLFLYFLPLIIFLVMVLAQSSYHYIHWQKDKNKYIPKGTFFELDSKELKKINLYINPLGKYLVTNEFIDKLLYHQKCLGDLSNIRFKKQTMLIHSGKKQFSAFMSNIDRLLNTSIQIGVNNDNTPKTSYKPESFKMLFSLETVSVYDLMALASRFACDCLNKNIENFDLEKLSPQENIDYINAYSAFIRQSLNALKPVKVPTNINLKITNFIHYVIMNNMTMNSPNLVARSENIRNFNILFTILSYFLLATQAAILATLYTRLL